MSSRRDFFNILKPQKKEVDTYGPFPPFFDEQNNYKLIAKMLNV